MSEDTDTDSDGPDEVQAAITQAHQLHNMIDNAKDWSRETAAKMRVRAAREDDAEAVDEIEQVAALIETVNRRIETGDIGLARQP
ncbi:hypothetical protein [Halonotius roseus]|uniref:Uncharacterized protein n=1 Tax=Halonotius roseus TaxID=2511997 RepID=A0A544QR27_9EURY|nr:hypothetical protein [Halonotius roseus]TQQ81896.1 hypothetical protein EWF95_02860 [Halonotius roseus]